MVLPVVTDPTLKRWSRSEQATRAPSVGITVLSRSRLKGNGSGSSLIIFLQVINKTYNFDDPNHHGRGHIWLTLFSHFCSLISGNHGHG